MSDQSTKNEQVIEGRTQREEAIRKNLPAKFKIEKNPNQDFGSELWDDIYNLDFLGRSAIREHDKTIVKKAAKHNLDPDMVRAVMFAEHARGHKLGGNYLFNGTPLSDSALPMNIQNDRWASLIDKKPDDLYDPEHNIEAGTVLLKRLTDRIEKPTPEKVGTLWQDTDNNYTNEFGEYIGKVYREKPWRRIE